MKKLALASVALAAVSTFGAGDAFGTTFVSSLAALGSNDTANWVPGAGGAKTVATVGPVGASGTYSAITSVNSTKGVRVTGDYSLYVSAGSSGAVLYGIQNHTPSTLDVHFNFPSAQPILYGSSSGTLKVSLSAAVKGVGFYVAPADGTNGSLYYATVDFFGDTSSGGTHVLLGVDDLTGRVSTGCTGSTASNCTFAGLATAGNANITGITGALIAVGRTPGASGYAPAISSVYLTESSKDGVPEPASLSVLGAGLLGLGALRLKRRRSGEDEKSWRWSPFGRWCVSDLPPDKLQT